MVSERGSREDGDSVDHLSIEGSIESKPRYPIQVHKIMDVRDQHSLTASYSSVIPVGGGVVHVGMD